MELPEEVRAQFAATLEDISRTYMPFGKYGPKEFPPYGVPIYDLPPEYLMWFAQKGFPQGRLGELLEAVHQIKSAGADEVFGPMRRAEGGRHTLRKKKRRNFDFGE